MFAEAEAGGANCARVASTEASSGGSAEWSAIFVLYESIVEETAGIQYEYTCWFYVMASALPARFCQHMCVCNGDCCRRKVQTSM